MTTISTLKDNIENSNLLVNTNIITNPLTNSNTVNSVVPFKGIGYLISLLELKIINTIGSLFNLIVNFLIHKYNSIFNFLTINILNSSKLTLYAKITILSTICLIVLKYLLKLYNKNDINRLSFSKHLFFTNKIADKLNTVNGSKIKLVKKQDSDWNKIQSFIEKSNKKNFISKEKTSEPFFRIMKYYLDFGNFKNKLDNIKDNKGNPYIKEEWKPVIKAYKFNSTDSSIIYVNITSPMCNKIVEYIPSCITPNLVTVTGLSFILTLNIITGYYSGMDGKGDIPTWAIILTAILYPMYHIFDLLDGKHARKTGQSSPLGLLVDHGCDAFTTFMFTMALGSILKLEGPFWYSIIWLITSVPFFLCTWEEYQTDRLDFPCVHGVSEGTFLASGVILFTAIVGQNFWLKDVLLFGNYYKLNNLTLAVFMMLSGGFSFVNFYKVIKDEKTKNIFSALSNTIVFVFLVFTLMILNFYSKSEFVDNNPKLIIYMYGLCFSKLVGHLQLAHLAGSKFNQFSLPIMFFLFTISFVPLMQFLIDPVVDMYYLIAFLIAFNFLAWFHFAFFVSKELCEFLGINMFLPARKTEGLQEVQIK